MTAAARDERIRLLFAQAKDLTAPEQARFLDEATRNDPPVVRRTVEQLLEADKRHWDQPGNDSDEPNDDFSQAIAPQLDFAPGDKYEVLREVARGGMGVVYLARHRLLEKLVALKVCHTGGWGLRERLHREARLLARVSSPHVVSIFDFDFLPDGRAMIALEWLRAGDMSLAMRTNEGRLAETQAIDWMADTCAGMSAAAAEGIVHRDLKPSNILIDDQHRACVTDFGLARGPRSLDELTLGGQLMGTPAYLSPEQAEDASLADTRCDIYSFGATFYHALTGSPPFEGNSLLAVLLKHKTEPLITPKAKNPRLTDNTCELIERCLAKAPADRFQSFEEISRQLAAGPFAPMAWEAVEDPVVQPYRERFLRRRTQCLADGPLSSEADTYLFPNDRQLKIVRGDIVGQTVDAIVSSDDCYLSMGGGVSLAIRAAGGPTVESEARRYEFVRPGRAVVTSGGSLPARYIMHGITLSERERPSRDIICDIMDSCFYHCDALRLRSIAFPLLGTGAGGFSREVCLDTMFRFLCRTLLYGVTPVAEVRIVVPTKP